MSKAAVLIAAGIVSAAAVLGGSLAFLLRPADSPPPAAPLSVPQIGGAPGPPAPLPPPPTIPPVLPPGITPVGSVSPGICGCPKPTSWVGVPAGQPIPVPPAGWRTGASFFAADGLTYYEMCPGN